MSDQPPLDFGAGESADPPQDAPTKPKARQPKPAAAAKPKAPKPPPVTCQRCNVPCEPVPHGRNWQRCPKCGWKHKTFDRLAEARRTARVRQNKSAR